MLVEPHQILQAQQSGVETEVLFRWNDPPYFEVAWDKSRIIRERFPDIHLEDKLEYMAGSDGKRPLLTYNRGKRGID